MAQIPSEILQQRWIHSHEEDPPGEMVFRPAGFAFPRSRGRMGFELRPDQSLVETGIAPADGPLISQGTWRLDADGNLLFYGTKASEPTRVMRIASATKDRLVVKK